MRLAASVAAGVAGVTLLAMALSGPRDSELVEVARRVRKLAGPRDLVLVAKKTDPSVVDLFDPLPAVIAPDPPLEALRPFRRVLVVGADRTVRTILSARFGAGRRHGGSIDSYSPAAATFDAIAQLEQATVQRGGERCPREGGRHRCAGPRWRTVERRRMTVGGHEVDCVFAHPSTDGLAITYPEPPGRPMLFRGAGGLSDRAAQRPGGPPVELTVEAGGRRLGRKSFRNAAGLAGYSFPHFPPGPLVIKLDVASQGARSFCLMLWGA
ncbi:MAG: hypothetical protein HYY06_26095 [Deltaproteobacteria bacterium]|nr:hypothetical protein [Deltaproteobacteria bacterium]